jgi:hypothetical protein
MAARAVENDERTTDLADETVDNWRDDNFPIRLFSHFSFSPFLFFLRDGRIRTGVVVRSFADATNLIC